MLSLMISDVGGAAAKLSDPCCVLHCEKASLGAFSSALFTILFAGEVSIIDESQLCDSESLESVLLNKA
jgi:hypothetical protein